MYKIVRVYLLLILPIFKKNVLYEWNTLANRINTKNITKSATNNTASRNPWKRMVYKIFVPPIKIVCLENISYVNFIIIPYDIRIPV